VFEANAAEQEGHNAWEGSLALSSNRWIARIAVKLTTHMNRIGEEVASVSDQENQATLDLGISSYMRELKQQTGRNSNDNSNRQAAKEDQHEDANGLEQTQDGQFASVRAGLVLLRRLKQHNSDSIVQN
jgi:hypothetical protein